MLWMPPLCSALLCVQVGEEGHVIGAVSGGVDSTVAAVLLNRAIGKRFHAVLVDNGVLRQDEATSVRARLWRSWRWSWLWRGCGNLTSAWL